MKNWIHLDLKGIAPDAEHLCEWLEYLHSLGFNGAVLEYDCRVPWETFPGAGIPVYSRSQVREIAAFGQKIGLEIVPLIQTQGHLEWLLKHPHYRALREGSACNELCPLHQQSEPLIKAWINEVIDLHPHGQYLHLGSDETWNLATCPKCQEQAQKDPRGKMSVYIDHVGRLCRHTLQRGRQPIIWGDMFWREKCPELAAGLPRGTVLINWVYRGGPPFAHHAELSKCGLEVWGASAVQCGSPERTFSAFYNPLPRLENVLGWQQTGCNLIHTVWGRPNNFSSLYTPWFALLPVLLAAGNPENWQQHPWQPFIVELAQAMANFWNCQPLHYLPRLEMLPVANPFEEQCRRWLVLALNLANAFSNLQIMHYHNLQTAIVDRFVGIDPQVYRKYDRDINRWHSDLEAWSIAVKVFFADHGLSDAEEFVAGRCAVARIP